MAPPALIAIMGPTASGKSDLAEAISRERGAVLINSDSFQVYRGLDIGTGKSGNRSLYRLIDIKNPDESFGVGEFVALATEVLWTAFRESRDVVVVGGTGLNIRALFEEYSEMSAAPSPELRTTIAALSLEQAVEQLQALAPELAARTDLLNPIRVRRALERAIEPQRIERPHIPPFARIKLAIVPEVDETRRNITTRVRAMVQNGWRQEVQDLLELGYTVDDPGFRAIGYRSMARVLADEIELEEAVATTIVETARYAKRQRAWLRSEPNLIVLPPGEDALALAKGRIESVQGTE